MARLWEGRAPSWRRTRRPCPLGARSALADKQRERDSPFCNGHHRKVGHARVRWSAAVQVGGTPCSCDSVDGLAGPSDGVGGAGGAQALAWRRGVAWANLAALERQRRSPEAGWGHALCLQGSFKICLYPQRVYGPRTAWDCAARASWESGSCPGHNKQRCLLGLLPEPIGRLGCESGNPDQSQIDPDSACAHYTVSSRCGSSSRSCLLYTSPSPRDKRQSRMPSSA